MTGDKKLSYRKQIARQKRAHGNNSKFSAGGGSGGWGLGFTAEDAYTGGGGYCRKHKFQRVIIFHAGR